MMRAKWINHNKCLRLHYAGTNVRSDVTTPGGEMIRLWGAIGFLSLALGFVGPAYAIVVSPSSSLIANYAFSAPVSGPFHVAHYEADGFIAPNSQISMNLQIFDSGNSLLGSRTITIGPSSLLFGDFSFGTGLGFPVPTSDLQGHIVITGLNQVTDFTNFFFSFYNNYGCCSTELLDLAPALQIVSFIAPLPDYWNFGDLPPGTDPPSEPGPGSVPEPATLALLFAALGLFVCIPRRSLSRGAG